MLYEIVWTGAWLGTWRWLTWSRSGRRLGWRGRLPQYGGSSALGYTALGDRSVGHCGELPREPLRGLMESFRSRVQVEMLNHRRWRTRLELYGEQGVVLTYGLN